jgi:hypothetical protein
MRALLHKQTFAMPFGSSRTLSRRLRTPAQQPFLLHESLTFIAIDSAQALRQFGMRIVKKCCQQRAASGANTR